MRKEVLYFYEVTVADMPLLIHTIERVGDRIVDAIDVLTQKITDASAKLSAEALQIADALRQNSMDPQRILAQADRVEAMGNAIAALIPDTPPPDPVEPV